MYLVILTYKENLNVLDESPTYIESNKIYSHEVTVITDIEYLQFKSEEEVKDFFERNKVNDYKNQTWCPDLNCDFVVFNFN